MKAGAAIVNTGSVTGILGNEQLLDYSMTKGGIHAFTRSLAANLIPRGIRVNAVAPGPVWTPLNPSDREAGDVSRFGAGTPMKRAPRSRRRSRRRTCFWHLHSAQATSPARFCPSSAAIAAIEPKKTEDENGAKPRVHETTMYSRPIASGNLCFALCLRPFLDHLRNRRVEFRHIVCGTDGNADVLRPLRPPVGAAEQNLLRRHGVVDLFRSHALH